MTTEEKREALKAYCGEQSMCDDCELGGMESRHICDSITFATAPEPVIDDCYNFIFGDEKEEINHPDRYKGGKFECIDVMLDVFGADAVKHFCILNAFKYLWRAEKKNGIEDIKKAVWYLNKLIELEEQYD